MNTLLRPKTAHLIVSFLLSMLFAAIVSPAAVACADVPQRKRVVVLRRVETEDGARFTLTSDSPLYDYRSYAEGERLVVHIPRASLSSTRGELSHARGFADLRVEEREADLLISFRLQTGATVAVSQTFNRLDVLFMTNEQYAPQPLSEH
ncbi:MAG TPA: hypothetical protein VJT74_16260 [Pyrinomonadaceae bacterium]|nr:hypothetical protein [Pyrinomonadaceae bacterium]